MVLLIIIEFIFHMPIDQIFSGWWITLIDVAQVATVEALGEWVDTGVHGGSPAVEERVIGLVGCGVVTGTGGVAFGALDTPVVAAECLRLDLVWGHILVDCCILLGSLLYSLTFNLLAAILRAWPIGIRIRWILLLIIMHLPLLQSVNILHLIAIKPWNLRLIIFIRHHRSLSGPGQQLLLDLLHRLQCFKFGLFIDIWYEIIHVIQYCLAWGNRDALIAGDCGDFTSCVDTLGGFAAQGLLVFC